MGRIYERDLSVRKNEQWLLWVEMKCSSMYDKYMLYFHIVIKSILLFIIYLRR